MHAKQAARQTVIRIGRKRGAVQCSSARWQCSMACIMHACMNARGLCGCRLGGTVARRVIVYAEERGIENVVAPCTIVMIERAFS